MHHPCSGRRAPTLPVVEPMCADFNRNSSPCPPARETRRWGG
ncbi:MAG: hypothetical protein ACAH89_06065 [Rariglobus sp.]